MDIIMFGHKRIPGRQGGVEVVVEKLAVGIAAAGHNITVLNRKGGDTTSVVVSQKQKLKGVAVKTLPAIDIRGLSVVTSSFLGAVLSAFSKADVVHIHAEGPAVMCWLPKLMGKKVVVTVHGLDWQRAKWKSGIGAAYIHLGERLAVKFADEIIVLSRNLQDYFRKTYGRNTVFIPNGVEKVRNKPACRIKEELSLEKNSYILYLGRIVPEKGVHYLIEAFQNIKTDKKLVIAGAVSDTEKYLNKVKKMAETSDDIIFTGFVQGDTLAELYSNARIYVLPSDLEGMPLSLLEAMSYGNCCLVSDIPECTEVIADNGVTFRKGDVESLRAELQKLCDNWDTVHKYKTKSADYICGKYSWDSMVRQTLKLYAGKITDEDFNGK